MWLCFKRELQCCCLVSCNHICIYWCSAGKLCLYAGLFSFSHNWRFFSTDVSLSEMTISLQMYGIDLPHLGRSRQSSFSKTLTDTADIARPAWRVGQLTCLLFASLLEVFIARVWLMQQTLHFSHISNSCNSCCADACIVALHIQYLLMMPSGDAHHILLLFFCCCLALAWMWRQRQGPTFFCRYCGQVSKTAA